MSAAPVKTMPSSPDVESYFFEPCTPVFWDVVDFPFPSGLDPDSFYRNIKSFLESMGCPRDTVSIRAYVDKENMKDEWFDDEWLDDVYTKAGITILPQQGNDYERGRVMLLDIALWAYKNDPFCTEPVCLIVVSKNIEKKPVFRYKLQSMASNYYRVFATLDHDDDPSSKLHSLSFTWPSTLLLNETKPIDESGTGQPYSHKGKSTEETVCSRSPLLQKGDESS